MKHTPQALAAALLLLPASLLAQACCEYPLFEKLALWDGDTARAWRFRARYAYARLDGFQSGESSSGARAAARDRYSSLPDEMTLHRAELSAGYSFGERWAAFLTLPFVRNEMDMAMKMDGMGMGMPAEPHWMRHRMDPVQGLGDLTALACWQFHRSGDPAWGRHAATLGAGLQLPTGEHDKRGSSGRPLHAAMQPGTGSWDPLASLEYSYALRRWTWGTGAYLHLTTPNPEGYEFGDSLTLAGTAAYSPRDWLTLRAGPSLSFIARAHDRDGHYANPASLEDDTRNTGGTRAFALAGVTFRLPARLTLDLTADLPVWADLNGIQQRPAPLYAVALSYTL